MEGHCHQVASQDPLYSPFNAFTPSWTIARLLISVSRRIDSFIGSSWILPMNESTRLDTEIKRRAIVQEGVKALKGE